jgi:signal transduction histidine kinase
MADHELVRSLANALPLRVMTVQSEAVGSPPVDKQRTVHTRADNPLVRAVSRAPFKLRTKLLVGFAGIVALLVLVAVLGFRGLAQSNARVERVAQLQLRGAAYQGLQTQAHQLRELLGVRVTSDPNINTYVGGGKTTRLPSSSNLFLLDESISSTISQLEPATHATRLGFVPPRADETLLERVRRDYRRASQTFVKITAFDKKGAVTASQRLLNDAIAVANDLEVITNELATATQAETSALVVQNRQASTNAQRVFVGVAGGSIVLALLLGFVLSWSLIGPIQRTESRLAEIAEGDFSRHVNVPNRDELGVLAANVNRMNDELGRLYQELETVSRHKSEFLANMSHELRTPLNAIIGFSDVLHEQMAGELNEQQLEYVGDVLEAGRHLLSLINDILDLSKIEAGHMELELSDVSVADVLQSGLTMHGERATRGRIALGLSLAPEEIAIRADERKVRQVVFNLLSNAIKFTPPEGRIDVSAQLSGDVVEVAVADSGAGIRPEDLDLIFEEFRQAPGDAGREGTGLGLPLSRKFIELHGGRLWVESAEGAGSTFRFTLPVEQDA